MTVTSLRKDHYFLCHSDGSECKDGCGVEADPSQLKAYLAEHSYGEHMDNQRKI